ncbi:MAG: DedA family protein [Methylophilaceae bacterium]|nr:DedA family protein [Methylophilaceae bacterium]MDG1820931.1 DedA family protein [Methylophilaceae bacterium]MDG2293277.1 DedA family protein [Methylophilaceae bacterium]
MKLFSHLYERVMRWSKNPNAPWYLGLLSFAESAFFPVPPDVMLAPMCLANPEKAWRFAFLTTVSSLIGGLLGYAIGATAFELITPYLQSNAHYWDAFLNAEAWFSQWGVWAIFLAGFSPIPYKIFTIAAGALVMPILPFTLASLIGRGLRFFMVAGLMKWGGASMEANLKKYVDRIGWATIALIIIAILLNKLF